MGETAKIFMNGRSQAVRLPASFRFDTKEVHIRRDPETGNVILSRKPDNWDSFLAVLKSMKPGDIPDDFLSESERAQGEHRPDPFEGWEE